MCDSYYVIIITFLRPYFFYEKDDHIIILKILMIPNKIFELVISLMTQYKLHVTCLMPILGKR